MPKIFDKSTVHTKINFYEDEWKELIELGEAFNIAPSAIIRELVREFRSYKEDEEIVKRLQLLMKDGSSVKFNYNQNRKRERKS